MSFCQVLSKSERYRALALVFPIFPIFSTYPPYFLLIFSKHRSYPVLRKRFYYLRNILFSFYQQTVQKNFKTSRCFPIAEHNCLESKKMNSVQGTGLLPRLNPLSNNEQQNLVKRGADSFFDGSVDRKNGKIIGNPGQSRKIRQFQQK